MENGAFASPDLKDELTTSLTSFVRLYDRRAHHLRTTSEEFTQTSAGLFDGVQALATALGRVLGGVCGSLSGGVFGAIGAEACDINAVDATVGFVSSIVGGVVGGALGAAVGTAVGVAAETTGSPVHDVLRDVAWFNIGFATGGAIGAIFGGTDGAKGGAIGGALGALCSTRFAVSLLEDVIGRFHGTKDPKGKKPYLATTRHHDGDRMQIIGVYREAVKPLVEELKTIKTICDKMGPSDILHSVAGQTANTLASVAKMEGAISDSQRATGLLQFASIFEEAGRRSKKITEELETTRTTVEAFLASLENQQ